MLASRRQSVAAVRMPDRGRRRRRRSGPSDTRPAPCRTAFRRIERRRAAANPGGQTTPAIPDGKVRRRCVRAGPARTQGPPGGTGGHAAAHYGACTCRRRASTAGAGRFGCAVKKLGRDRQARRRRSDCRPPVCPCRRNSARPTCRMPRQHPRGRATHRTAPPAGSR